MKVGVISDTHDNLESIRKLRGELSRLGVSYLVHLGDFVSPFAFKELFSGFENSGVGVLGNNDGEALLLSRLASKLGVALYNHPAAVELEGLRIFLMHGFGDAYFTIDVARAIAQSGRYDFVLFGHTHAYHLEKIGDIVLLNPGEGGGWLTGEPGAAVVDTSTRDVRRITLGAPGP